MDEMGELVVIAVKVPHGMARELRLAAAYAETSMSEVHRRALRAYLNRQKTSQIANSEANNGHEPVVKS